MAERPDKNDEKPDDEKDEKPDDGEKTCPECDEPMKGKHCSECGYDEPGRNAPTEEEPTEEEPTGEGDDTGEDDGDSDDLNKGLSGGAAMAETTNTDAGIVAIDDTDLAEFMGPIIRDAVREEVIKAFEPYAPIFKALGEVPATLETISKGLETQSEGQKLVKGFLDELSRGPAGRLAQRPNPPASEVLQKGNSTGDLSELESGTKDEAAEQKRHAVATLAKAVELKIQGKPINVDPVEFRKAQFGTVPPPQRIAALDAEIAKYAN